MKKDSATHTSQDHDRKRGRDHIASNPRAAKDTHNLEGIEATGTSVENAELISKGSIIANNPSVKAIYTEDKRETARHEHTHHFTNRATEGKK